MNHEKRIGLSYRIGEQATQAILTVELEDPFVSAPISQREARNLFIALDRFLAAGILNPERWILRAVLVGVDGQAAQVMTTFRTYAEALTEARGLRRVHSTNELRALMIARLTDSWEPPGDDGQPSRENFGMLAEEDPI